jgi:two-component system, OmpR family, phosphate regulon sensor histidine kinase PhoR
MGSSRPRHVSERLRRIVGLVLGFVIAPSALLLSVGILVLVFSHAAHDVVFGVLIVSLVATMAAGTAATLVYLSRAEALATLQTDFVAKVSHDLRTPLTSIRMFVETLQLGRADDPEKTKQCLAVLAAETTRLTAMIDRLLAWGRMEAGRRSYVLEEEQVADVVDGALTAFAAQTLQSPVTVNREVAPNLPPVEIDLDAMSEAVLNLLENAHRYAGSDKQITVRCERRRNEVTIVVSDNGRGVPMAEQRSIFEKFYRGRDSIERDLPGSGLGLAIVEHIVRAHRGRITLDSKPGRGATFTIWLPVFSGADAASG